MGDRWITGRAYRRTGNTAIDLQELERMAVGEFIEIADTGIPGTQWTLPHNLGRVPRSVTIARQVAPVLAPVTVHQYPTDPEWTNREINVRFDMANARVMLEVR